jgi:hypothetical protein
MCGCDQSEDVTVCFDKKAGAAFEGGQHGRYRIGRQRGGTPDPSRGLTDRADLSLAWARSGGYRAREENGGWSDAVGGRRRSAPAAIGGDRKTVASRPSNMPVDRCGEWGRRVAHGVDTPAQQITFSKDMNWALSLPGACLPLDQSAPGRPILTHLPPLTGSMIWSL